MLYWKWKNAAMKMMMVGCQQIVELKLIVFFLVVVATMEIKLMRPMKVANLMLYTRTFLSRCLHVVQYGFYK